MHWDRGQRNIPCKLIEKEVSKSALSQHQETTGHLVAKKPVIEKMMVVENEARIKSL